MPPLGKTGKKPEVKTQGSSTDVLIPCNLAPLAKLCEKDKELSRWALKGVYVESLDAGTRYRMIAGNKYRMVIVEGQAEEPSNYPKTQTFMDAPGGKLNAVIPAAFISEQLVNCQKLNKKSTKPILRNIAVRMADDSITTEYTDLDRTVTTSSRNSDGNYPRVDDVVPKRRGTTSVILNGKQWCELADAVAEVCKLLDEKDKTVQLDFYDSSECVVIRAVNEELRQKVTAIIMPDVGYDHGKKDVEGFSKEMHRTEDYWQSEALRLKGELDKLNRKTEKK